MKAISFLGITDYKDTNYKFPVNNTITTQYFPYAVNQIYNPEDHFILMTKEAKEKHFDILTKLFKFHDVEIPSGKDEIQFWEIFDDIVEIIDNEDEILLDFTFGFRSQPVLAISALIYLKALKKIKISKVIYGAFDAIENEVVPVFDLTSFIELIDWSYAAHDFLKYGKAGEMSRLMSNLQKDSYLQNENPEGLKCSGIALRNLTQSMSLANTIRIFENSYDFSLKSAGLINDLQKITKTKPIGLLLDKITNRIEPISSAKKNIFSEKGVDAQFSIIEWLLDTEQFQQAITLMNEIFLSLECLKNEKDAIVKDNRTEISKYLGEKIERLKDKSINSNEESEILLWNILSEIRNEINHAGINTEPTDVVTQTKNIKKMFEQLKIYYNDYKIKYADKFIKPPIEKMDNTTESDCN